MAHYTYVSDAILRDLVTAKSKLTDVRLFVDANAAALKDLGLLDDLSAILHGPRYTEEGEPGQ